MAGIFAGIDAAGDVRFIDDVPSGRACALFCSFCNSSLVAKKGKIKKSHFAHEALQERPECVAGAVNLLRRLALDLFSQRPPIPLPKCRVERNRWASGQLVTRQMEWSCAAVARISRTEMSENDGIDGWLDLVDGNVVPFTVVVRDKVAISANLAGPVLIALSILPPRQGDLTSMESAKDWLLMYSNWQWIRPPGAAARMDVLEAECQAAAAELIERQRQLEAAMEVRLRARQALFAQQTRPATSPVPQPPPAKLF